MKNYFRTAWIHLFIIIECIPEITYYFFRCCGCNFVVFDEDYWDHGSRKFDWSKNIRILKCATEKKQISPRHGIRTDPWIGKTFCSLLIKLAPVKIRLFNECVSSLRHAKGTITYMNFYLHGENKLFLKTCMFKIISVILNCENMKNDGLAGKVKDFNDAIRALKFII